MSKSSKSSNGNSNDGFSRLDIVLWAIIAVLVAFGVWANEYYANVDWALRAAGGIVVVLLCLSIAINTTQGAAGWKFLKDSRRELRRVVWPAREETGKTTAFVVGIVILMAFLLWGVDTLLFWAIGYIMS